MKRFLKYLPWALIVLLIAFGLYFNKNIINAQLIANSTANDIEALQDLEGKSFEWTYPNFDKDGRATFRIQIQDGKLTFEGIEGEFLNMVIQVRPHFTKIADNMYFLSWQTIFGGEDSLVLNFNTNEVFAHVKVLGEFTSIKGNINCNGLIEECPAPNLSEDVRKL